MHNQKTCIFIAPIPPPLNGQSIASKLLYDNLTEKFDEVYILDTNKKSYNSGIFNPLRVFSIFGIYYRLLIYLRYKRPPDLIYFSLSESLLGNCKDILFFFLLRKYLDKTVVHLHGGAGLKVLFRKYVFLKRINQFYYDRLRNVIVLGPSLKEIFDGFNISEKLSVVYNYASDSLSTDIKTIEDKFSEERILKILFCSNLIRSKGFEDLLDSLDFLNKEELRKIQIVVAGATPSKIEENILKKYISRFPNTILFVGFIDGEEKVFHFQNSNIFCLPTYYPYEGQPISILEAYASGQVVITTDHSGISDIFQNKYNGFYVNKRCPKSIADSIKLCLENRSVLVDIAINNFNDFNTHYRAERHLSDILKLF